MSSGVAAAVRRRLSGAFVLPTLVVAAPWFFVFHAQYGVFTPDWIKPDAALIAASPLVERAMSQPWHYYVSQSSLIAPVVLVTLVAAVLNLRRVTTPRLAIPLAWVVWFWVVLLVLRWQGHSEQLRFLTPAVPGLYVLLGSVLARSHPRRSLLPLLALVAVLYGSIAGGFYLLDGQWDEIMPVPEMLWRSLQGPHAT